MVPFMMGRIVNAAQVLQSLSVPDCLVGRELVIGIRDEQVPLNTMLVKMHFDEKGITLFNTLDDPTVLMDISSLTQLFFGTVRGPGAERRGLYPRGRRIIPVDA